MNAPTAAAETPKPASAAGLEHYWMPFTDNRRFKRAPKMIASAPV